MKGLIRTIDGDIKPSEVKYALTHEHGFLPMNKESADEVAKLDPAIERRMISEFKKLRKQGVNVFVEVSPMGDRESRRRGQHMLRAAKQTGMHVVGTTGCYTDRAIPADIRKMSVSRLAERFYRELTEGMDDSNCRAGMIKASGGSRNLSPAEKKTFLAAAEAHKQTGAPITTHCPMATMEEFKILKDAGVPPEKIALGHIEVSSWIEILKVAREGAMFLFTNFGGLEVLPEEMIIAQVLELVRQGYIRQIMLSVDMFLWTKNGTLTQRWPGGYAQLMGRVIPELARRGLKPSQIETIMHENPTRHLTWE